MDQTCRFECELTQQEVIRFSQLSGDRNPLHVDAAYARTTEYGRPIVHGALLVGLVSRVLGMHIPGTRSLLLSMKVHFPKPLFYPARVQVEGRLKSFHSERQMGLVHVVITDLAKLWSVLEAEAAFALHAMTEGVPAATTNGGLASAEPGASTAPSERVPSGPQLLVTGGTGGLGSHLVAALSDTYAMRCLTRRPHAAQDTARVSYDQVDVEEEGALEAYLARRSPSDFCGIVHLSVPPVPRAFVSDDLESVRRHLRHSVEVPLLLAQWARQPGSRVKRLILCGSTFGTKHPKPQLGAYALGKAAMESLARLLTGDFASQGATVNVVAPTVIPVGLNEGMSQRAQVMLVGKMPTQRLVEPRDVADVVRFLLSEKAGQINGATIAIDGDVVE